MTRNGNLEKLIFTANTKDHSFVSFFVLFYIFFVLFISRCGICEKFIHSGPVIGHIHHCIYYFFMAILPLYVAELAIVVAFQSNCNSSGAKILVASTPQFILEM